MSNPSAPSCTASAVIAFPRLADYLEPILAAIATHDMTVRAESDHHAVTAAFGSATLRVRPGALHIEIEAADPAALNRMKHALAGPIGFIAAQERLDIQWRGDAGGLTPLDDLRILRVATVRDLTPYLRRIVLQGVDLAHLDRADQLHCRLIFAPKGEAEVAWPMLDGHGRVTWPGGKMPTRVYTIRAIDPAAGGRRRPRRATGSASSAPRPAVPSRRPSTCWRATKPACPASPASSNRCPPMRGATPSSRCATPARNCRWPGPPASP